ncbi:MAG TPA: hypothetical protein VJ725_24470 [Thermoanaerobaculia bacterium]|nr:hypothetical protein [Thermoanaerobaculia bacterium]
MLTAISVSCLAALLALPVIEQSQPCSPDQECKRDPNCPIYKAEPVRCELGKGELSFETAEGSVRGFFVVVQDWQIANDVTVEIPHKGWLIVNLQVGELTTGLEEERQEWHAGAYWTVPADQPLIIQTARDSVVLQTVELMAKP